MKEEKQEAGHDSTFLPQKAEHFALPDSKPVMPARQDGKRKPKAKKTDSSSEDNCFIGQTICGVVDGSFDAGYMLTVRVGDTDTILRGIVFEPGLSVPISEANDIAPNVKLIKRDESFVLPEAPNTSNSMPIRKHSHVPMLRSPVSHAIQTSSFLTLKQIGSGPTDMECCQPDSSPSKSTCISEAVSRLPSAMPPSNAPATSSSSVGMLNQMEPPMRIYFGQKDMVSAQAIAVPFTTTFTSQAVSRFPSPIPVPGDLRMPSGRVQNQAGVHGQTDTVSPQPDAIPSKSSSISQSKSVSMLPFPIPVSNILATSSVNLQNQMKYPYATVGSGKTDTIPPQADGVLSKSTSISEAVSRFPSPVPLPKSLATSSVHLQNQMRYPYATVGSGKTDTVPPQPSISEAVSRLPAPVPLPNALATSSVHVQNQMGYPCATVGSGKTDTVPPQPDGVPSKSTSISEAFSRLPSPVPLPNALATSPVHVKMEVEPSLITGSPPTDIVPPQLDANSSKSTFMSQALTMLPSSMPASNNALGTSIVHVHNEMGPPATGCSGQKDMMPVPSAVGMPSAHLQNQTVPPLNTGSGQIDMVAPMLDAKSNPLKSTFISQTSSILPFSMPASNNALTTSTVHVKIEIEPPETSCSAQNDDLGMSCVHLQKQTGPPLMTGSSQIDMALPQPDPILSKSTSIFQSVPISPSSMAVPSTLANSSAHVQNQMGHPATIGSFQTDTMPQQDGIPPKSASVVQAVPTLSSAMPVPNSPASPAFFIQNTELPLKIALEQTDLVPSQPDAISPKSCSISQTLPMLSVPAPVPNAASSVVIQNQVEPPVKIKSVDTNVVLSQPAAISPKSTSISESPATMPVPNAPSSLLSLSSVSLQNQMGQSVTIKTGQTDAVATQSQEIPYMSPSESLPMLQASIPITCTGVTSSEPSTNSKPEPDSRPSDHDFHSTEATEIRMDVDGGA